MNNKVISLSKSNIISRKVVWNHPSFPLREIEESMGIEYSRAIIPEIYHKQYLECVKSNRFEGGDVLSIIKGITDIFNVLTQRESPINPSDYDFQIWSYLNHLAIIKLDVLIQKVSKSKRNVETEVTALLIKLVRQANVSSVDCFQVSVHFACKFFAKFYPERREEINKIIALEKHQREIREAI